MLDPKSEILYLLFVETFNGGRNAAARVAEVQNNYYIFLCYIVFELWFLINRIAISPRWSPNAVTVSFIYIYLFIIGLI